MTRASPDCRGTPRLCRLVTIHRGVSEHSSPGPKQACSMAFALWVADVMHAITEDNSDERVRFDGALLSGLLRVMVSTM